MSEIEIREFILKAIGHARDVACAVERDIGEPDDICETVVITLESLYDAIWE